MILFYPNRLSIKTGVDKRITLFSLFFWSIIVICWVFLCVVEIVVGCYSW